MQSTKSFPDPTLRPSVGRYVLALSIIVAGAVGGPACNGGDHDGQGGGSLEPERQCNLRLSKSLDGEHTPGGTATYSLIVDNVGTVDCEPPITVTDELPPGVSLASANAPNWSCSVPSQNPDVVECEYDGGTLAPQTSTFLELDVDIGDEACMVGNCAEVANGEEGASSDRPVVDATEANNRDCASDHCGGTDGCVDPPSGMVGWWTGDQTGADDSSENNHGSLVDGAHYATGQVLESFGFDGTDDHVRVPDDPSLNFGSDGSFTIDAWVNPTAKQKPVHFIVDKREDTSQGRTGYALQLRSNTLIVRVQSDSNAVSYSSSGQVPDDEWTHVTLTVDRDADQGTVYLDGAQDGTFQVSSTAGASIDNGAPLLIGSRFSGDQHFKGRIDEVEIFSRALSDGEVQALADAGPCGKCRVECFDGEQTIMAGEEDDFADGADSASPSQYLQDTFGPLAEFDDATTNGHFGHTFSDLKPTLAHQYICGATLEIRMRPTGSGFDYNDTIRLSFSDGNGNQVGDSWGIHMGNDDGVSWYSWNDSLMNTNWHAPDVGAETFTLDLANLDPSGSNPTNLMSDLNSEAMLNVRVQDDTEVDWARLIVDYECEACDFVDEQPDLAVDKSHEGELTAGEVNTYSISVENVGTSPADPTTTITDEVPECMEIVGVKAPWDQNCTVNGQTVECEHSQPIQPGEQLTDIELEVRPSADCGDRIENCVEVAHDGDTNADNDSDCDVSGIDHTEKKADLNLRKKAGDEVFTNGTTGTWEITVENNGPAAAQGPIEVTDDLPSCMSFDSAAPSAWSCNASGGSVSCTHPGPLPAGQSLDLELTVEVTDECEGGLRNCANVQADAPSDPNPGDNKDCDDAEVQRPEKADLSVDKTHADNLIYDQANTYEITVKNDGPGTTQGPVTVTDDLPRCLKYVSGGPSPWNCSESGGTVTCTHPGPIGAGQSETLNLEVEVTRKCADIVNNCAKASVQNETDPSNNEGCDRSPVKNPKADMAIDKTHSGPLHFGQKETYTIQVTNNGPGAEQGPFKVVDDLPSCLKFDSAGPAVWTCNHSSGTVTCTHSGPLAVGASEQLKLTVVPNRHCGDRIENCAKVRAHNDPDNSNNEVCVQNGATR